MRHAGAREEGNEDPVPAVQERPAADKGTILVSVLSPALLVAALFHSSGPREASVVRPGGGYAPSTNEESASLDAAGEDFGIPSVSRTFLSLDFGTERVLYSTEFGWEGPDLLLRHGERTRVVHFRFEAVEIDGEILQLESTEIVSAANRIEYHRGPLTEWYQRRRSGWEQGFTIARAPAGNTLRIEMKITTTPAGPDDDVGTFRYPGAAARDADGNPIPVRLVSRSSSMALIADVSRVRYPLVVFPASFYEHERRLPSGGSNTDRSGRGR